MTTEEKNNDGKVGIHVTRNVLGFESTPRPPMIATS
jgi:hypothetical protein